MEIKEIEHLAELSKLEFTEQEIVDFAKDFESIVKLANKIKDADISGERAITTMPMADLREDEPMPSTATDILLQNAPDKNKDSFIVPRIME